jgi:hypothetical protein
METEFTFFDDDLSIARSCRKHALNLGGWLGQGEIRNCDVVSVSSCAADHRADDNDKVLRKINAVKRILHVYTELRKLVLLARRAINTRRMKMREDEALRAEVGSARTIVSPSVDNREL